MQHLGANDPSETSLTVGNSNISNNSQGIVITGTNNQMINSDVTLMGQKNIVKNTYGNIICDANNVDSKNSSTTLLEI